MISSPLRPFARILLGTLALTALLLPCVVADAAAESEKVIILGFDGVDPDLVQEFFAQGELPHLRQLAEQGSFSELGTTNPAESPVSWATFTTGQNPGYHGIFDFLRRVPQTYYPDIALARQGSQEILPSKLLRGALAAGGGLLALLLIFAALRLLRLGNRGALAGGFLVALPLWALLAVALFRWLPTTVPTAETAREGTPFWDYVADSGLRATVIDMPVTFPAYEVENLQLTTGLGTPDIRKSWGTYLVFSSARFDESSTETAGILVHVMMNGDRGETEISGPQNFMQKDKARVTIPMSIERLDSGSLRLSLQGESYELGEGEWTDFVRLTFQLNPLIKLVGTTRFKLLASEPDFRLYMEPMNFDPHHLPSTVNISSPREYAGQLADDYGLRETLGWSIATNPLKDEMIDVDTFLEDLYFTLENREKVIKGELAKEDWDLFIGVFLSTDRMQHMMYRFFDPGHPFYDPQLAKKHSGQILEIYRHMDRIVGDVMRDHVDDDTLLMVVSDHGFHSFRTGVNINTWLVKNGYMTLKGLGPDANIQKLEDLFDPEGRFYKNVDWSKTQAYCLGLGSIYINLKGREPNGAVSHKEYKQVREEIISALKALEDPDHPDLPVVRDVFRREDIFRGPRLPDAPDLFVGFETYYRVSWQTSAGGIPPEVFEDNLNNWSGDHCSFAPDITSGIFLSNRKLPEKSRHIADVSATVLQELGVPIPAELEGVPLQEEELAAGR